METAERNIVDVDDEALEGYRTLYWEFFTRTKYQEYYLRRYKTKTETILSLVSGLCVIGTFVSISGSLIAQYILWWVACIVVLSQIAQAIIPYTTVHKKVVAVGFMLPELQRLLIDIEASWNEIDLLNTVSLEDIPHLLKKYKRSFNEMELKYFSDINFESLPHLFHSVENSAKKDCTLYFKRVYNVDAEEVKV